MTATTPDPAASAAGSGVSASEGRAPGSASAPVSAPASAPAPASASVSDPAPVSASAPASPHRDEAVETSIGVVETELAALFQHVRQAMKHYAEQLHPELPPAAYKVISTLNRCEPVHSGALAGMLEMDKSSLSRQIRVLDELGFIVRTPDPNDGRASFLSVEPATARRIDEIRNNNKATMHENLRAWPVDDLDRFGELLGRLNRVAL